jgi:hypothetical protein
MLHNSSKEITPFRQIYYATKYDVFNVIGMLMVIGEVKDTIVQGVPTPL